MPALTNNQHEIFALAVSRGLTYAQAYKEAGYNVENDISAKSAGSRLANRKAVVTRIAELKERKAVVIANTTGLSKTWVIDNLRAVANRCMQAEPVVDHEGHPTGEYTFNASGANRALELIGKELGMFVERKDMRITSITELSREQLMGFLSQLDAAHTQQMQDITPGKAIASPPEGDTLPN